MKKKYLYIISLFLVIILLSSFFIGYSDNKLINTIKYYVPKSVKNFVKDKIFFISDIKSKIYIIDKIVKAQNNEINDLKKQTKIQKENINYLLKQFSENNSKITLPLIEKSRNIKTEKNNMYQIKKFYYSATPWQYNQRKPSGYLYQHNDNIFVVSGSGEINYFNINEIDNNELNLKFIKNNILEFLDDQNIVKSGKVSIRGIFIKDKRIFLSYMKKIKENCYNIAIMNSELNLEKLIFSDFFTFDDCSADISNHTGGRMIEFNENSFLFTIGDGQKYAEAQKDNSLWGKILQININGKDSKILAKGLRNTQGGDYYEKGKILIMSDHGPSGGDEINILNLEELLNGKTNFGWPIATYGEIKYIEINENKFTVKDKLNHKKNGFKEPLEHFSPSVAPSHILNVNNLKNNFQNDFFLSTMGNSPGIGRRSIHHLRLDNNFEKIIYKDVIGLDERIRDMIYIKDKKRIILLLELSPSIAVLEPI